MKTTVPLSVALLACAVTALLVISITKSTGGTSGGDAVREAPDTMSVSIRNYRECMLNHPKLQNYNLTWDHGLEIAVKDCYKFGPNIHVVNNKDEQKKVLMLNDKNAGCVFVTLGVGQDATAEEQIKTLMPNCKFYGADPVDEGNKEKYEKVGAFYNFAVSSDNVSESMIYTKGRYTHRQNITAVPLIPFIKDIVKAKVVDFLFVDIEYAEYDMFPLLQANYVRKQDLAFCQINIEAHGAQNQLHKQQFHDFIVQALNEGTYTFTYDETVPGYDHHRIFLYNHLDAQCTHRFFPRQK